VTFSLTCHGSELLKTSQYRLAKKVEEATFVACVSHYGRAQLMLTCPPEQWPRLKIIRCGISPALLERAANKGQGSRTILCVGRLSPEKGHLVLLEALIRLHDRGCRAQCLLVGDGPMRQAIETGAARMALNGAVRLAGALPADEVLGLYSSARMVVLASFTEGVPVVLMEAMAAGCPVVATRVGGVGELVQDGVTGRLVSPGDPEALADAIEWVLDNPADAQIMAQRARRVVDREFSQEISAERLAVLFRGCQPPSGLAELQPTVVEPAAMCAGGRTGAF
jgi:glycosyltransferase involved in cell wall biosynthesis